MSIEGNKASILAAAVAASCLLIAQPAFAGGHWNSHRHYGGCGHYYRPHVVYGFSYYPPPPPVVGYYAYPPPPVAYVPPPPVVYGYPPPPPGVSVGMGWRPSNNVAVFGSFHF